MKTQFIKQLELIQKMACSNIAERMERCDILTLVEHDEKGVRIGRNTFVTQLKKDRNKSILLYDGDVFISNLETLNIEQLCVISDELN